MAVVKHVQSNGSMLALPGTIQNKTGWYETYREEVAMCVQCSVDEEGGWSVLDGPTTKREWKERQRVNVPGKNSKGKQNKKKVKAGQGKSKKKKKGKKEEEEREQEEELEETEEVAGGGTETSLDPCQSWIHGRHARILANGYAPEYGGYADY
jgi:hypothetical protein